MIYVDTIMKYPTSKQTFKGGSCHMFAADPSDPKQMAELHDLAFRIGLKRSWFQEHKLLPHYDLTPSKRAAAIVEGAISGDHMDAHRAILKLRVLTDPIGSDKP